MFLNLKNKHLKIDSDQGLSQDSVKERGVGGTKVYKLLLVANFTISAKMIGIFVVIQVLPYDFKS